MDFQFPSDLSDVYCQYRCDTAAAESLNTTKLLSRDFANLQKSINLYYIILYNVTSFKRMIYCIFK